MKFRGLLIALLLITVGTISYRTGEENAPAQIVVVEKPVDNAQVKEVIDPRTLIGERAPEVINVVIEIQQGTQTRYTWQDGVLRLSDAPYHPLNMPGDYGVLPQTFTKGGEMLGVIVLTTDSTPPGTLIEAKPIALLIANEGKTTRNVILAVPTTDIRYRDVEEIADLQQHDKDAVIAFIKDYHNTQGRPAKSVQSERSAIAKKIISLSMQAYLRLQE